MALEKAEPVANPAAAARRHAGDATGSRPGGVARWSDIAGLVAELPGRRTMYDLAHEIDAQAPVFADHPPYHLSLHRRHEDPHTRQRPADTGFANEVIVTSAHVGTHIDALGHFSAAGRLHDGTAARDAESAQGLTVLDASALPPICARGLLFDVAGHRGVDCLGPADVVDAGELAEIARTAGLAPRPGDAALIRTGWARHWSEPTLFRGARGLPGIDSGAAEWLLRREVGLVGSDTPTVEAIPFPGRSVHAMMLVEGGVPLVENLVLEELAAACVATFLLLALPLRLAGATGSPLRPVALA